MHIELHRASKSSTSITELMSSNNPHLQDIHSHLGRRHPAPSHQAVGGLVLAQRRSWAQLLQHRQLVQPGRLPVLVAVDLCSACAAAPLLAGHRRTQGRSACGDGLRVGG